MTDVSTITIRRLHELAFGEQVAEWYDEACAIWRAAYGQPDDPPALLLPRGGFSGYGKHYADAGPAPLDGRLTGYLIRLFANDQTQSRMTDEQFRRDLIGHELGHVFERHVLRIESHDRSTHDSTSWRHACSVATPHMVPELVDVAAAHGVTVADVFGLRASRVQRCNGVVTRVPIGGALPVPMMASWPHAFRDDHGRAAFAEACTTVAVQLQRNDRARRIAGITEGVAAP